MRVTAPWHACLRVIFFFYIDMLSARLEEKGRVYYFVGAMLRSNSVIRCVFTQSVKKGALNLTYLLQIQRRVV